MQKTINYRFNSASDLVKLDNVAAGEVRFLDNGKECIYRGEMYDIVSITKTGQNYSITAYHDIKEKNNLDELAKNIHNNLPGSNDAAGSNTSSKQSVNKLFISSVAAKNYTISVALFQRHAMHIQPLSAGYISVINPPPDFLHLS